MPFIEVIHKVWIPDLPEIDLPYEDGVPLESHWHRLQINLLNEVLEQYWHARDDFFAGGNMFIYYSMAQVRNRDYKGPDFFVVQGVERSRSRRSWIVWDEGGRYPDVIVELLSPTTAAEDLGPKKDLYEQVFRTAEYFCVNPDGYTLQGWRLTGAHYVPIPLNTEGQVWSERLQLWLGFEAGSFQGTPDNWVQFFDPVGRRLPTGAERADTERAMAEAERAMAAAARKRAEAERERAEAALAENAHLRAELERLQRRES
ncbi:MAG: Uma2 family endonuclease [Candidatus Tectomicrobia bacterium]|uniref:Uma2 family endonuclease n=1 Tax=Tectimicrobiota bacterium TaxID=2528274 RepID=A0A937W016_UNCTE|nr:Uma2 family endonuclease [Candidatus Tectomicrobia bacterium]